MDDVTEARAFRTFGTNVGFLFLHLSSPEALPVSKSPSTIPSPPDLSDTPPHSLAWALPLPGSCSHIPFGHSPRMEKPSLIPFLLPAPGSDMLVIPVGDGQRDNAWHGARLCHHRTLRAVSGRTPAHTECPPWPLSSWLSLVASPSPGTRWRTQQPARRRSR